MVWIDMDKSHWRKDENSIAGYAMEWNPLSQSGWQAAHPRNKWRRTVVEEWKKLERT